MGMDTQLNFTNLSRPQFGGVCPRDVRICTSGSGPALAIWSDYLRKGSYEVQVRTASPQETSPRQTLRVTDEISGFMCTQPFSVADVCSKGGIMVVDFPEVPELRGRVLEQSLRAQLWATG